MNIKPLIKGLMTYIPGMNTLVDHRGSGGTGSAQYCYGIWMKHLTMLWQNGLHTMPQTLAELGPGASIGVGLAALLSGVNNYYALDVVERSNTSRNLAIFNELVHLFKQRAARPTKGWPDFDDYLDATLFPNHILTEQRLEVALTQERIDAIKHAIVHPDSGNSDITVQYVAPWHDPDIIRNASVDFILSHSVLEHVTNLELTYTAFFSWLKPQGWMSHQIDFSSHGSAHAWNGHWAYSELLWKIIVGKRPYLINRQPYSIHLSLMKNNGFTLLCDLKRTREDGIQRSQLASSWKDLSEDDLVCSGAFIIASKAE